MDTVFTFEVVVDLYRNHICDADIRLPTPSKWTRAGRIVQTSVVFPLYITYVIDACRIPYYLVCL